LVNYRAKGKNAPKGVFCGESWINHLFDRGQKAVADRRFAADDLDADFRVGDATGGNPIEAPPLGHIEAQLPHVPGDLPDPMKNVILDVGGQLIII
jgi:hypothetical protein